MKSSNKQSLMSMDRVAERLEALREAIPMPKGEFADSIEIDRSSYSKIIRAEKPLKIEMGFVISERWGVTLDYLYRGSLFNLPDKYAKAIIESLTHGQQ